MEGGDNLRNLLIIYSAQVEEKLSLAYPAHDRRGAGAQSFVQLSWRNSLDRHGNEDRGQLHLRKGTAPPTWE